MWFMVSSVISSWLSPVRTCAVFAMVFLFRMPLLYSVLRTPSRILLSIFFMFRFISSPWFIFSRRRALPSFWVVFIAGVSASVLIRLNVPPGPFVWQFSPSIFRTGTTFTISVIFFVTTWRAGWTTMTTRRTCRPTMTTRRTYWISMATRRTGRITMTSVCWTNRIALFPSWRTRSIMTATASFFFLLRNGWSLFDFRFFFIMFLLVFTLLFRFAFAIWSFRAVSSRLFLPLLFALFLFFVFLRFGGSGRIIEDALLYRFRLNIWLGRWTWSANDGISLFFCSRAGSSF